MPTMTLTMPTKWKASLQPGIPMNDVEAIKTEQRFPRIEPRPPVSCNHPNAVPRLLSSVESATRDCTAERGSNRCFQKSQRELDLRK
ncbi:hypothetical protein BVRB_6g135230 [Beta vulgaris subsp. vulgaris]|nr:hypothetical protein BVRB_6g135230 [Beta vulgaris subsp. vulgaris]